MQPVDTRRVNAVRDTLKCVIFTNARRPDVVYVKTADEGTFSRNGHHYVIDSSRYLITKTYRLGVPIDYMTLYYRQGRVKPINPTPLADLGNDEEQNDDIMSSREWYLARDPDLMSVLRPTTTTAKDTFMFYLNVGIAAGVGYLVLGL